MNWYLRVLQKYVEFDGRAQRAEYWMFFLVNFIIVFVLQIIASKAHFVAILAAIYVIAVFLPSLAVAIRRLHDTDRSGWWVLISLVPLIGGIWLLILMVLDGTPGGNRFGPDPKQSPL